MRRARKEAPKQRPIPEAETIEATEESHRSFDGRRSQIDTMKTPVRGPVRIDTCQLGKRDEEGVRPDKGARQLETRGRSPRPLALQSKCQLCSREVERFTDSGEHPLAVLEPSIGRTRCEKAGDWFRIGLRVNGREIWQAEEPGPGFDCCQLKRCDGRARGPVIICYCDQHCRVVRH